jgi:diguanylate cyclase
VHHARHCGPRREITCGPIDTLLRHLADSVSGRTSRPVGLLLLAAILGAPSLLLPAHTAVIVEPLVAAAVVTFVVALWHAGRHPEATLDAEFRALHDSLTGLPNRTLFDDRLEHALAQSMRGSDGAAVMVIDLDRFKEINDTHGHAAGDVVLREVAERLAAILRNSDTVARLGGDEFGVVLSGIDLDGARESASRMQHSLGAPVDIDGSPVEVGASFGIAVHPQHGTTAQLLVHRADVAMYEAKRTGTGYAIFDAAAASTDAERRQLAAELRGAVRRHELCLHYQPRIDLRTGEIAAVEALARWEHPSLGLLVADDFMTLAEESGLGTAICNQILLEAVRQSAVWASDGAALPVSVNVDARSLADPGFPKRVARMLAEHDVPPESIELELSEGTLLAALTQAQHVITDLADVGVRVVVDNFGVGYSSLGYLAHVPISKLKIHRSLVLRAERSSRERTVVAATVALAHDLGVEVVAEGVEDEGALEFVRSLAVDYAQGYHLGAPAPAAALSDRTRMAVA